MFIFLTSFIFAPKRVGAAVAGSMSTLDTLKERPEDLMGFMDEICNCLLLVGFRARWLICADCSRGRSGQLAGATLDRLCGLLGQKSSRWPAKGQLCFSAVYKSWSTARARPLLAHLASPATDTVWFPPQQGSPAHTFPDSRIHGIVCLRVRGIVCSSWHIHEGSVHGHSKITREHSKIANV